MHRRLGRFLRHHAVALLALFLALGGTSYAAAGLINGAKIRPHTIAKNRLTNRAIRQLKGSRGPRGLRGPQGMRGTTGPQGPKGDAGAPGPGATSFFTTRGQGTSNSALATAPNGITAAGSCTGSMVVLIVRTTSSSATLQVSGTAAVDATVVNFDSDNTTDFAAIAGPKDLDVDVIARDSSIGPFARVDLHGTFGAPCRFWGMITPSS